MHSYLSMHRVPVLLSLIFAASLHAEEPQHHQKAIAAAQSHLAPARYEPWFTAFGDIDGDGIPDVAFILTSQQSEGPRDERLLVLLGSQAGTYTVLASSDAYCGVRYHYDLEIKGSSIFVKGWHRVSPDAMSNSTLQFRFNQGIRDLELIGVEHREEDTNTGSYYRESTDYIRGVIIHSKKQGKRYKEVKAGFASAPLARLTGFNCETYDFHGANLHIDDNFAVKRW